MAKTVANCPHCGGCLLLSTAVTVTPIHDLTSDAAGPPTPVIAGCQPASLPAQPTPVVTMIPSTPKDFPEPMKAVPKQRPHLAQPVAPPFLPAGAAGFVPRRLPTAIGAAPWLPTPPELLLAEAEARQRTPERIAATAAAQAAVNALVAAEKLAAKAEEKRSAADAAEKRSAAARAAAASAAADACQRAARCAKGARPHGAARPAGDHDGRSRSPPPTPNPM